MLTTPTVLLQHFLLADSTDIGSVGHKSLDVLKHGKKVQNRIVVVKLTVNKKVITGYS